MKPAVLPAGGPRTFTSQELDRADSIVLAALELPSGDRQAYVARMCADSPVIRKEVESLLNLETSELARVDLPVFQFHGQEGADSPAAGRIGPYRIERELGRGGVAAVYLGRRIEDPDQRRLALKVLRPGLDSQEIVRGLRREGQILAHLRHPNIARVFGGGVTDDQRPYLVMEYIEGETLDSYLRHRQPELLARLELFLEICAAVDYAHRRLVVHSDIKPSNVLVTTAGEPRLLDFGIAKLLDAATERPVTVTALGRRMLTPGYASPEQVRQQPVTTATDVYALGVVLYEMLCGRRPLDFAPSEADWRRAVCEHEPPPPSRALEVNGDAEKRRLRRRLAGDLDAIVTRALSKEPEHRYPSVRALAHDLRRHLQGEPVTAHRGGLSYRTAKWLRRRRRPIAVCGLVCLLLVGYLADRQRQLSRMSLERDKAFQVRDVLIDLLTGADPYVQNGEPPTVRDVLDRSYQELEELEEQPEVQAMVMGTVGAMYASLGDFERAAPLLGKSLAWERAQGDSPVELAQALHRMATVELDRAHLASARELLGECVELLRRSHFEGLDLPLALGDLGLVHRELGESEVAMDYFLQALEDLDRLAMAATPSAETIRNNLGLLLYDAGRYAEAVEHFELLLADRRAHGDRQVNVGMTAINLASSYHAIGDHAAAEPAAREAVEILSDVLGPDHPNTAAAALALAKVLRGLGKTEDAVELLRRARRELGDGDKAKLPVAAAIAGQLGDFLVDLDPSAALAESRHAVDLWQATFGPDHPRLADFLLAVAMVSRGEEARRAASRALEIYRRHRGEDHAATAAARRRLGELNDLPPLAVAAR